MREKEAFEQAFLYLVPQGFLFMQKVNYNMVVLAVGCPIKKMDCLRHVAIANI